VKIMWAVIFTALAALGYVSSTETVAAVTGQPVKLVTDV
jgi:hypothetical protein